MPGNFRIGLGWDFLSALNVYDLGLELLDAEPRVTYEFFHDPHGEVSPEQAGGHDALILGGQQLTRTSLGGSDMQLSIVARIGVGYDMVDVEALTEHDVLLTITPDGIRRPMATAIVTFILALTHELFAKDRLARQGPWEDRPKPLGRGLEGRVVGSVGVGNIGRELFRLLLPFDMVHLAADPVVKAEELVELRVEMVDLETLLRRSDLVCINCPLAPATRGLIGKREIGWMKPTAYLINTARGPIVDEVALTRALEQRRIKGAGLDVFSPEPPAADNPLLKLDNVILTPHSLGVTDQCLRGIGESAIRCVLAALKGEVPPYVVNRKALERPGLRAKLDANRTLWSSS